MQNILIDRALALLTLFVWVMAIHSSGAQSLITPFENGNNQSANYFEVSDHYQTIDSLYPFAKMQVIGETDAGKPLHAIILDKAQHFQPNGRLVYFINNGIHAGEPCGVDASMMWVRDLLDEDRLSMDVVVVVIPVYNVGGMLNRNSHTRANQLGPAEHGFRGNAKNLDLNRDFIKCDSKNAASFSKFYSDWQPHVFLDTHTSNGADYQHTMTLINTQPDRLPQPMRSYLRNQLVPLIYGNMKHRGWEMTPYVYAPQTPDKGIYGFLDLPRYSSGYAALHHAFSFISEAHMLKPFKDRVNSTYQLIDILYEISLNNRIEILSSIEETRMKHKDWAQYPLSWQLDTIRHSTIVFEGYEAKYKPSKISEMPRLYYDHDEPYTREVVWFEFYKPVLEVTLPKAYLIPVAYYEVANRLKWNNIEIDTVKVDTTFEGEVYNIENYSTSKQAYEGHYPHSEVELSIQKTKIRGLPGDMIVPVQQEGWRFIIETLEPQSPDSYFAWNFMDAILQRKEYFSSYVFEDLAAEILDQQPEIKKLLDQEKEKNPELKKDARAQLNFIYTHSAYAEKEFMRYPISRISQ